MKFEIPFIVEVEADDRGEAEAEATDLADSLQEVFRERVRSAVAVITEDHNILERLGIKYEGEK